MRGRALFDYPVRLTPAYWDERCDGIADRHAKAELAAALTKLGGSFDAIPWAAIDTAPPGPAEYTPQAWADALDTAIGACDGRAVRAARRDAAAVQRLADWLRVRLAADAAAANEAALAAEIGAEAGALLEQLQLSAAKRSIADAFERARKVAAAAGRTDRLQCVEAARQRIELDSLGEAGEPAR